MSTSFWSYFPAAQSAGSGPAGPLTRCRGGREHNFIIHSYLAHQQAVWMKCTRCPVFDLISMTNLKKVLAVADGL